MPTTWGQQTKYGDYEIAGAREGRPKLLGEGSFGKTFAGVRSDEVAGGVIEEEVAVKVLNPDLLKSQTKRFQFIQELLALTKFKHSNLIHYIRCGEQNGEVYYAMELCRGGDLVKLVKRFGALPERVAALIGLQVASGLKEVHQRHRLVHRDIKPSNIMLVDELGPELSLRHLGYRFEEQDSLCRVVDFGLVNVAMNAEETPQRFVGSPMYASPEQIREQPMDGRCDIYALGMTLWYLVQGRGPMLDEAGEEIKDPREAMRRHTDQREHGESLPRRLSAEFRAILERMLAKRPERRYVNAGELQGALRTYLSKAREEEAVAEEALGEEVEVLKIAEPLESVYEGGILRAGSGHAVARIVAPGVVQSPYASAGSTQQLSWESWKPGGEFVCAQTGMKVALPLDLPGWAAGESGGRAVAASSGPAKQSGGSEPRLAERTTGSAGDLQSRPVSAPKPPPPLPKGVAQPSPAKVRPPLANETGRRPKWKDFVQDNASWIAAGAAVIAALFFGIAFMVFRPSPQGVPPVSPPPRPAGDQAAAALIGGMGDAALEGKKAGELRMIAGMPFRWCPATGPQGFLMGSPSREAGRMENEVPHSVVLTHGFWLAETELTQGQWQEVMGTTLGAEAGKALADDRLYSIGGKSLTMRDAHGKTRADAAKIIGVQEPKIPIYWVSWEGSAEYCRRLTDRERGAGKLPGRWQMQLPSEAQWEHACRAGTQTATYAGDLTIIGLNNAPLLDGIAWYGGNSGVGYVGPGWNTVEWKEKQYPHTVAGPHPVGSKAPNAWGLKDLLGNEWEWCDDWYAQYSTGKVTDPAGAVSGSYRVLRGSSWNNPASACRAACRSGQSPGFRDDNVGFRIAVCLPSSSVSRIDSDAQRAVSNPGTVGEQSAFSGRFAGERKSIGGIPFRWCPPTGPAGFTMGSLGTEQEREDDEAVHRVVLSAGFWMAETELTQAQWALAGEGSLRGQATKALADDGIYTLGDEKGTIRDIFKAKRTEVESILGEEGPGMPIYWVNWKEAADCCRRLTDLGRASGDLPAGWRVALPAEAQWEYACRAGTSTGTIAGEFRQIGQNNAPILDAISWYSGNSGVGYSGAGWDSSAWPAKQYAHTMAGPRAVGQKKSNAWGLNDMEGNVWEWCADWYGPYPQDAVRDPLGPSSGTQRVDRGGSWSSWASDCRVSRRDKVSPDMRLDDVGFRIVVVQDTN